MGGGLESGESIPARSDSVAGRNAVPVNSSQRASMKSCLSSIALEDVDGCGMLFGSTDARV